MMLAAMTASAQNLEVTAMGSYKSTWLFNKNISDLGNIMDYSAGWGYSYGLGITWYFNKSIGVEVDGLYNLHTGAYTGTDSSNQLTYTSSVKLHSLDIPVLFKLRSKNGAFIEVGPQFSTISAADFSFKQSNNDRTADATPYYSTSNVSAVLGFGEKIKLSGHFSMRVALRFEYGLTDLKGVDGFGQLLSDPKYYPNKASTNSAAGGFMIGFTYSFGAQEDDSSNPAPPPAPPH